MPTLRERGLEQVRRIVLDRLRGRRTRVYLFGSTVTGATRPSSDIDVAIDPLAPLPPGVLTDLREALDESNIPYDVDLIDLSAAPPAFQGYSPRVIGRAIRLPESFEALLAGGR